MREGGREGERERERDNNNTNSSIRYIDVYTVPTCSAWRLATFSSTSESRERALERVSFSSTLPRVATLFTKALVEAHISTAENHKQSQESNALYYYILDYKSI